MLPAATSCVQPRLLLRLLHRTTNADRDWSSISQNEWLTFGHACEFHQLNALAFRRLDSVALGLVPADVLACLRDRFYKVALRNLLLAKRLVQLSSHLEAEQIPVMAYKGPSLAVAVFGDLALREFQDIDLLVPEQHLRRAIDVMTRAGFESAADSYPEKASDRARYHHLTFYAPDRSHFVELHWKLAGSLWRSFTLDIEKIWIKHESVQLPDGTVSTMCPEDMFLALCCHGTTHRWWCLKWLVDIAELLRHSNQWDWSRIEEITVSRPGARAAAALAILLAHELLGAAIPAPAEGILPTGAGVQRVANEIREEILSLGCTEGDPHRTLLSLEDRRLARMKYRGTLLVRTVTLFRDQVITVRPRDRALIRLPRRLDFLYRCVRLMRLAVKSFGIAAHAIRRAAASLL